MLPLTAWCALYCHVSLQSNIMLVGRGSVTLDSSLEAVASKHPLQELIKKNSADISLHGHWRRDEEAVCLCVSRRAETLNSYHSPLLFRICPFTLRPFVHKTIK